MASSEKKLINLALELLYRVGAHPYQKKAFLILAISTCILRLVLMSLALKLLIENFGDITIFIECCEGLSTFMQGFSKLVVLIFYKDDLVTLINGINKFWISREGDQYKYWFKFFGVYKYFIFLCYIIIVISALIDQELQFMSYVPDVPFGFPIMFLAQTLLISTDLNFIVGMDLFFIGSCIVIRRQFELLQEDVRTFQITKDEFILKRKFAHWVRHHDFMIGYINKLNKAYKYCLFIQYFVTTYCNCIQLYMLTESSGVADMVKCAFFISGMTFQLSLFCIPADTITHMAGEVATSLAGMQFYDLPVKFQKNLPIMILRCQRPIQFKAGGMFLINREAFTVIFKTSISFYSLVKEVKDK